MTIFSNAEISTSVDVCLLVMITMETRSRKYALTTQISPSFIIEAFTSGSCLFVIDNVRACVFRRT